MRTFPTLLPYVFVSIQHSTYDEDSTERTCTPHSPPGLSAMDEMNRWMSGRMDGGFALHCRRLGLPA